MTFQFPGGFFWTKVLSLHLHLTNGAIPKRDLPPFEDTIRFHQKISFGFHLQYISDLSPTLLVKTHHRAQSVNVAIKYSSCLFIAPSPSLLIYLFRQISEYHNSYTVFSRNEAVADFRGKTLYLSEFSVFPRQNL